MPKQKSSSDKSVPNEYKYKKGERALLEMRKKRFEKMYDRKKKLGIDSKCDRMDDLYSPHLTNLDDQNNIKIQTNQDFLGDAVLLENSRKSMPLAFEKITTAQAILIKENPKGVMKAFTEADKERNLLVQNAYYENFSTQRKKEVLKKYTYHLAKYSIGYWREYIKKTYRKEHYEEVDEKTGKTTTKVKWVYNIFDVVGENIHPHNVILDNNCISVKDVNKPANDCIITDYLSDNQFESYFPEDVYPNAAFVKQGQQYMLTVDFVKSETVTDKPKIQVLYYENVFEDLLEVWANGIPISSVPLPGHEISICGDKWTEDKENYDGVGIGQIIELYQPLVDDIVNADNERLRQLVRPSEDWFNGLDIADESEDVSYGAGSKRHLTGQPKDLVYNRPPARTAAEAQQKEEIMTEIDLMSMAPRDLGGGKENAKTAYQAAQRRESALSKLQLPLFSIKKTIEDAANLDLKLYQIAYSQPIETNILTPQDDGFDEAIAIAENADRLNIEDDRIQVMSRDKSGQVNQIARRKFKTVELPLVYEKSTDKNNPTGRIITSDEHNFWEFTPKDINWKGRMEIIAESFVPVSKAVEDEQNKETINYLMNIPITDDAGRPTLTDATGKPYTIDKVRLAKERCRLNRNFDPEKFIVPLSQQNAGQGSPENANPLESKTDLNVNQVLGNPPKAPVANKV